MPVSRAPKNASKKKSAVKKSTTAKKSSNKSAKKVVKKGPRLFPTKAELEALKNAKAAKSAPEVKKGPRRFPTKAELEAMKAAQSGITTAPVAETTKTSGKKLVEKIDGEDVELEEVELEDLEKLVAETGEETPEGQSDVRVVNLTE